MKKEYRCDHNIVRTSRLILLLVFFFLTCMVVIFLRSYPAFMAGVIVVMLLILIFLWFYYLERFFSTYYVCITDDIIRRRGGWFFFKESTMPLEAVRYARSVTSTALSQMGIRGLNIIIIYAYGGMMYIPFLSDIETNEIKEILDRHIGGNEGETMQEYNFENKETGEVDIDVRL